MFMSKRDFKKTTALLTARNLRKRLPEYGYSYRAFRRLAIYNCKAIQNKEKDNSER